MAAGEQPAPPARRRPPTLHDVARAASVTPSTASRALHDSPRISQATKRRVTAAARRLGYRPNRLARSLRTTSHFVGIVVPDIGTGFYARFVKAAQDALEQAGYQALLMNTEREGAREEAAVRTLLEHRVGGILLATSMTPGPELLPVPTVLFDDLVPGWDTARVAQDNRGGIATLVEHLAWHGHTRVAYLGGPPTLTSGRERLDAFRRAVRRLGLDRRREYVELGDPAWSSASGAGAMRNLLALDEPPSAIVAAGDTFALGAMSACRDAGVRVPAELALVSFDDPAFGELLDPPVTALARTDAELGRIAASLLVEALAAGEPVPPVEVRLPAELVVRRSCGCDGAA